MLNVTIWGTRGGVPVSGAQFARYGGATTCLEITCVDAGSVVERVLIDAGTGLSELGRSWGERAASALFLQSHFHWDHIQGFPFFGPLYNPSGRFEMWAVPRAGSTIEQALAAQMRPPNFPIGVADLPASIEFRDLVTVGSEARGELSISWTEMAHPAGSSAFRLEYRGASVVFTSDVEVSMGCAERLSEFARGVDLFIMDAQYLPSEYEQRRGFGHSTIADAVEVARAAGVGELVLTHHDASHDDAKLDAKLEMARELADGAFTVSCARDGVEYEIGTAENGMRQAGAEY